MGDTPAEELRAAAAKLREMAKGTTRAPWMARNELVRDRRKALEFHTWTIGPAERGEGDLTSEASSEADARWMALMHPGLAEPLAALLDVAASTWDAVGPGSAPSGTTETVLTVARVINGSGHA